MNTYLVKMSFEGLSESLSKIIKAESIEDARAHIHPGDNLVSLSVEESHFPDEDMDMKPISEIYIETVHIQKADLECIYTCIFGNGYDDERISNTIRFADGSEIDVAACGNADTPGWTETLLFQHGCECGCSEPEDKYEGIWDFSEDGVAYVAAIIPEESPWIAPNVIVLPGSCLDSTADVIAHQTNCKGVMGAGIALAIRNKYPEIMPPYQSACNTGNMLGKCQLIETVDGQYFIANLFGQAGFGSGKQTNYDALQSALNSLVEQMCENGLTSVSMPYNIGCGLAGGDWNVVLDMLVKTFSGTYLRLELWQFDTQPAARIIPKPKGEKATASKSRRYTISIPEDCDIPDIYVVATIAAGFNPKSVKNWDCRKILVSQDIFDAYQTYMGRIGKAESVSGMWLMYGPKICLDLGPCEVEIQDGFLEFTDGKIAAE